MYVTFNVQNSRLCRGLQSMPQIITLHFAKFGVSLGQFPKLLNKYWKIDKHVKWIELTPKN